MTTLRTWLAAAVLVPMAASAAADDALPGVSQPDPIVEAPPPEPDAEAHDPRIFRIGNTDVRISGSVTIDVTAGDVRPRPNR